MEAQDYSVKGTGYVHGLIDKVKKRANPRLEILGYLINRYDGRRRIEQDFKAMIQDHLGDRAGTRPLRTARLIEIERIQPDPNQPRKTFVKETLESLAQSIREIGGIIDPITVQFSGNEDCFLIISGERRYRAAKLAGLDTLPCIVKQPDDKTRFLMQFIANIQREDIPPLEEAAAIRRLVQTYGFTQHEIAKLINKSKSYVSQCIKIPLRFF